MVNLAEQDTSFLIPCRHCGDLLPEQDRICPHCGKDQTVAPAKGAGTAVAASGPPSGDVEAADPFATPRDPGDFTAAGFGPHAADDGAARRRRKAIGVVALIAGVLLLGMAYDRYTKQRATTSPPSAVAQDAPVPAVRPASASGPVARTPSAATTPPSTAATPTAPPVPPTTPPAAASAAPAPADTPAPPCSEALAALSLCVRP